MSNIQIIDQEYKGVITQIVLITSDDGATQTSMTKAAYDTLAANSAPETPTA